MLGIAWEAAAYWGLPAGWPLGRFNWAAEGGLNSGLGSWGCGVASGCASGLGSGRGGGGGNGGVGRVTEGAGTCNEASGASGWDAGAGVSSPELEEPEGATGAPWASDEPSCPSTRSGEPGHNVHKASTAKSLRRREFIGGFGRSLLTSKIFNSAGKFFDSKKT